MSPTLRDLVGLALTFALVIGSLYAMGTGHFITGAILLPLAALPLSAVGLHVDRDPS